MKLSRIPELGKLWDQIPHVLHFTDRETETQRSYMPSQGHQSVTELEQGPSWPSSSKAEAPFSAVFALRHMSDAEGTNTP